MARREIERLSAKAAATITEPGRHADGGGLYLNIGKDSGRRWVFLYRQRSSGRLCEMGIGPAIGPKKAGLSLKDARQRAAAARQLLWDGKDPLAEKRAAKVANSAITFGEFADDLIDSIASGFKSKVHIQQWRTSIKEDAASLRPILIRDVSTEDVLRVLRPVWESKAETASRLRGRIERVLDAAKAKGLRTGENPARWRGHLRELLPKRKKLSRGHHAALHYDEAPAFFADLRDRKSVSALALEWTILNAVRTGETIFGKWCEVDRAKKVWTIDASRMKAGREHRIPLSVRAMEILDSLLPDGGEPDPNAFIFPGAKPGAPLSNMAMLQLVRDLRDGLTVHGWRSSFKDWASDRTSFPNEVIEMALAHTLPNKVEASYRRLDALEKRRKLMDAWAAYLAGQTKIISLRKAG